MNSFIQRRKDQVMEFPPGFEGWCMGTIRLVCRHQDACIKLAGR
ncbi:MAG: hypothetical protein AB7I37_25095 [Pirellulales bacterium]